MSNITGNGRLVTKDKFGSVVDHKGKGLNFEEQEDGTFKAQGSESDGNIFTYYLEPIGQPQYTLRVEKKAKGGADTNEAGQKTVGDTFKASDKTKDEFVRDYGSPQSTQKKSK